MKNPSLVLIRTWEGSRLEAVHVLQMPPKPGSVFVTRLLFVAGGLFLALFLAAGYAALDAVSRQEAVRRVWLDIAKSRGLSEKLVPAVQGEPMLELASLVLLAAGVLLLGAALARHAHARTLHDNFTIGDDPSSSWVCSARRLPSSRFELARIGNGRCRVQICDWMQGSIRQNGNSRDLAGLAHESAGFGVRAWNLDEFEEVEIRHDSLTWVITPQDSAKMAAFPLQARPGLFAGLLLATFGVFGAMLMMFDRLHEDPFFNAGVQDADVQLRALVRMPDRVAEKRRELETARIKDPEKKPIYEPVRASRDEKTTLGPRDPRATKMDGSDASVRVAGPQGGGVANVLASAVSVMTASLTANNAVFGQETEDFSDLLGDFGNSPGGEEPGFGPRGSPGPGSSGTLGIGGPPRIGWGNLPGTDRLGPPSLNPVGGNPRRQVVMRDGTAQVAGRMDPNEVRAVIRAHRNEVHHCYQKGLLEDDRLAGVVRVIFLLNASGRASDCRVEENLSRLSVGECICGRILNWRFPQPEGSLVRINYSWVLQPGNQ